MIFLKQYKEELKTRLLASLKTAISAQERYDLIVNTPFEFKQYTVPLGIGIIVLLLKNEKDHMVDRIALSRTDHAKGAVEYSVKEFNEIRIPLDADQNIIVQTIKQNKPSSTSNWKDLFIPALNEEEARFNQAGAGISHSHVYPLSGSNKTIGALIYSYYADSTVDILKRKSFMKFYSDLVAGHVLKQTGS